MNLSDLLSLEVLQQVAAVCGAIIFTIYMSFKAFKSKLERAIDAGRTDVPKKVGRQSVLDCEIMQEAERIKEIVGADRVQVYEFHNGTHYANGRSALKTTCTYEACRYGISSCLNMLSGVPLSVIPNFIKILLNKGELLVENLEDIKVEMPSTYAFKHDMGIKSFYDVIIYNRNGEPVGFVAVQFCSHIKKDIDKDIVKKFAWFVENKLLEM